MPKLKCVQPAADEARKCLLLRADGERSKIDEYAKAHNYEIEERSIQIGYDNLSMSKLASKLILAR